MNKSEEITRAKAVKLILEGKTDEALRLLSQYYKIETPSIKIGLPKGHVGVYACYIPSKKTIYVKSSKEYRDPYIVLHEYYHHLRIFLGKHRGTEKHANKYALDSIKFYIRYMKLINETP
ncbi:MAG: hypothetical protein DRO40_10720 [Thermoprotei archaeon]|nr:MAG: hypothetical protein DRO40_10720 [Thermoprotei archaeon]